MKLKRDVAVHLLKLADAAAVYVEAVERGAEDAVRDELFAKLKVAVTEVVGPSPILPPAKGLRRGRSAP